MTKLMLLTPGTKFKGWGNCDVCGNPIKNPATATISVCYKQINAREEALRQWKVENVEVIEGAEITSGFADYPDQVPWMITHVDCECPGCLDRCGCDYWFYGTRFDSLGKVVAWTLHLMKKTWFASTDWEGLVRRLYDLPAT